MIKNKIVIIVGVSLFFAFQLYILLTLTAFLLIPYGIICGWTLQNFSIPFAREANFSVMNLAGRGFLPLPNKFI